MEMLIALVVLGVLLALTVPRVGGWLDRLAVRHAALEVMSFYNRARLAADVRSTKVRLDLGGDPLSATFEGLVDSTFLRLARPVDRGVDLQVTREVVRLYPNGLGFGAANTKIVVAKGSVAESLTTSRRGRLKLWR